MLKNTYLLTILAAFLLVFTSCDKDKESDPAPSLESQLSAKQWRLTDQKIKRGSNPEQNILPAIYEEFEVTEIKVKLDGKGGYIISSQGQEVHDGTYEVKDGKVIWNYPASFTWLTSEEDIHNYTAVINGNTLTLSGTGTYQGSSFTETITFTAN